MCNLCMKSWSLPQQSKCIVFSDEKILYSYFLEKSPNKHMQKNLTTPKAQTNKTNPTKFMSPISICTWRIYYTGVSKELLRTCIFLKEHGRKKFLINFRIKLCKNIILSLHNFFQIVLKNRKAWESSRQLKGTLLWHS